MHRGCARVFVIWEYACIELKLHFQSMNALEDFDVSTTCTIRLAAENLSKWLENENLINCNYVGDYKGECCHALNSHRDIWSLPPYARARADKLKRSVIDGGRAIALLRLSWRHENRDCIFRLLVHLLFTLSTSNRLQKRISIVQSCLFKTHAIAVIVGEHLADA